MGDVFFLELSCWKNGAEGLALLEESIQSKGISYALESNASDQNTILKLYSFDKHQLREFLLEHADLGMQSCWQTIDSASWSSGWAEVSPSEWYSKPFTVAIDPTKTSGAKEPTIYLQPTSTAFGNGDHISTSLMLEVLVDTMACYTNPSILDFGAGTGILAIAAAKLGATFVFACEIDSSALEVACKNFRNNACTDIQCGTTLDALSSEKERTLFSVTCCNIQPPLLTELLPQLIEHTKKEGILVLSGYTNLDKGGIASFMGKKGFQKLTERESSNWIVSAWCRNQSPALQRSS